MNHLSIPLQDDQGRTSNRTCCAAAAFRHTRPIRRAAHRALPPRPWRCSYGLRACGWEDRRAGYDWASKAEAKAKLFIQQLGLPKPGCLEFYCQAIVLSIAQAVVEGREPGHALKVEWQILSSANFLVAMGSDAINSPASGRAVSFPHVQKTCPAPSAFGRPHGAVW